MKFKQYREFIRFASLGILVNFISFAVYCIFTAFGVTPKVSMSIVYFIAVCINFLGQKAWVFKSEQKFFGTLYRYIFIYVLGYVINWMLLEVFANRLSYTHELVQAVSIVIVALFLYLSLKHFVFIENLRKQV